MRVVSLVPSWTETLIEAGVEVVGRTRFCIHPAAKVAGIPRIGGTKDWDWPRIVSLKPTHLILDREENPKFMGEQAEIPTIVTHVRDVGSMPTELTKMADALKNAQLQKQADEWQKLLQVPSRSDGIPAIIQWGIRPTKNIKHVVYVIWKDPWMAAGPNTFIASMLARFGLQVYPFAEKYPKIDFSDFDRETTLLLFSSEPFPFLKKQEGLAELGFPYAFVDGESFSWFGIRAFRFLQRELLTNR